MTNIKLKMGTLGERELLLVKYITAVLTSEAKIKTSTWHCMMSHIE